MEKKFYFNQKLYAYYKIHGTTLFLCLGYRDPKMTAVEQEDFCVRQIYDIEKRPPLTQLAYLNREGRN